MREFKEHNSIRQPPDELPPILTRLQLRNFGCRPDVELVPQDRWLGCIRGAA
jgi:hypothetical protein